MTDNENRTQENGGPNLSLEGYYRPKFLRGVGYFRQSLVTRYGLPFVLSLLIAFLVSPYLSRPIDRYEEGQFTTKAIRAPYDFSFINEAATEIKREEAARNTPPVARVDRQTPKQIKARIDSAFSTMQAAVAGADAMALTPPDEMKNLSPKKRAQAAKDAEAKADKYLKEQIKEKAPQFENALEVDLTPGDLQLLREERFSNRLLTALQSLIDAIYQKPIAVDKRQIVAAMEGDDGKGSGKLTLHDTLTAEENQVESPAAIQSEEEAVESLDSKSEQLLSGVNKAVQPLLLKIAKAQVRPNLTFDPLETDNRRVQAREAVVPVSIALKKNQLILGEGQEVTAEKLLILSYLREEGITGRFLFKWIGTALLFYMLILIGFQVSDRNLDRFVIKDRDFLYIALSLTMTVFLFRIWLFVADSIVARFPGSSHLALMLAFPIAALVMHTRLLLSFDIAALVAVCICVMTGLLTDLSVFFSAYVIIVSLVGGHLVSSRKRRGEIIKAGLWVGLIGVGGSICLMIVSEQGFGGHPIQVMVGGLTGGLLAGFMVVAVSPLAEWVFGYTTNFKLSELANYDHPLLKQIMLSSPGTFQHSVSLGVLCEAAAEAVGADPLLVRVGALFHDAGKSVKAGYFVENQQGVNPHDRLTPKQSANIIKAHVIEGVRLVRKYSLPEKVADFVREHHGTGLIKYFYVKELESGEEVNEDDFRYPGPKPQSKETGILMIADQVEAVSRTLSTRDKESYREMIGKTIERVIGEGQLDECPLTMKDLANIQEAFAQVLTGMHHQRVKYPGQKN